jgi:hypothetical protein
MFIIQVCTFFHFLFNSVHIVSLSCDLSGSIFIIEHKSEQKMFPHCLLCRCSLRKVEHCQAKTGNCSLSSETVILINCCVDSF